MSHSTTVKRHSRHATSRSAGVLQMLDAAGWARDRDEENVRGVTRIYIRLGTGERELGGAVEEISEMLEPRLMANGRVRNRDPIWVYWERMNPGIGHLLPGTDEHIP